MASLFPAAEASGQAFRNYESPQVHPLRVSADGDRLYAVNTPDNRLTVYSLLDPAKPILIKEILVGLEPVSVTARTIDELWVVNRLSDSVSIVSISRGIVIHTIHVTDEPADVVFAGEPQRAFVSVAGSRELRVFDPNSRALVATIPIFGDEPRALASSRDGARLWVAVHRSGNRTTIVPRELAPPPPPPTNPNLPKPPQVGLIVSSEDPSWKRKIEIDLPDFDVIEIDPTGLKVRAAYSGAGTIIFGLAVRPGSKEIWVANTEARNLVQFEPSLRGHVIDSRVTRIVPGTNPSISAFDLNPGIDYTKLSNPQALASALSQPTDLVFDPKGAWLYVAAMGTDRIGVVDPKGKVVARIEVGHAKGTRIDPRRKRGPRGLAHHPTAPRLYVLNRLANTIGVVDTKARAMVGEIPMSDPTPVGIKQGRGFLYDAKLSGNGMTACASCHVDGDLDGLAWDLGDRGGKMHSVRDPVTKRTYSTHPMKGPMLTQTLVGLKGTGPFHWRGDKTKLEEFNPSFASLLGGSPLSSADMATFIVFLQSIEYPPNPNQNLDRTLPTDPRGLSPKDGYDFFTGQFYNGFLTCANCHALPAGTNRAIFPADYLLETQPQKVAQLRNIYKRTGRILQAQGRTSGFGLAHDGSVDRVYDLLSKRVFGALAKQSLNKKKLAAFALAMDTGTAPAVGYSRTVSQANIGHRGVIDDLDLLCGQAAKGNCDLIAKGELDGRTTGLLYLPASGLFESDQRARGRFTREELQDRLRRGSALLTFLGVPPGAGLRIGLDRDLDRILDGDEGLAVYGTSATEGAGALDLTANSDPLSGNDQFALVCTGATPSSTGMVLLGLRAASTPVLGMRILVDMSRAGTLLPMPADGRGTGLTRLRLPTDRSLVGLSLFTQAVYATTRAAQGLAASQGLRIRLGR